MEINLEEIRKLSLMIATPAYGGNVSSFYMTSMMKLVGMTSKYGISLRFFPLNNESLVQRARNYCVDNFLRSDSTHLLFIDSDIEFDPDYVFEMLHLASSEYKGQILCGSYPKKGISWEKISKAVKLGIGDAEPNILENYVGDLAFNVDKSGTFKLNEPIKVSEAATGFMLIPREVFDKFKKAYPEYEYTPDHSRSEDFDGSRKIVSYFHTEIDPVTNRYLSEDYWFCRKVKPLDVDVYILPWMKLNHIGTYKFKGNLLALAEAEMSHSFDKIIETKD